MTAFFLFLPRHLQGRTPPPLASSAEVLMMGVPDRSSIHWFVFSVINRIFALERDRLARPVTSVSGGMRDLPGYPVWTLSDCKCMSYFLTTFANFL